jgi:hypothetical protein
MSHADTQPHEQPHEPIEYPADEYSYGGFTVRLIPVAGEVGVWRVETDDVYFGLIKTAEPVRDEPGVHFASHFAGEEDIPPTTVDREWTKAVQFLIDAKD